MKEDLESFYRIFPWIEDPFTSSGYKRYCKVLEDMEAVIQHEWFRQLIENRREISIMDV